MKKFIHSFWVLSCILVIVFNSPQTAHSNQSGAPDGKTGSPGDGGALCTDCHSDASIGGFTEDFMIMAVDAPLEYNAGEVYSFDIIETSLTASVFGFELIAEDDEGNHVGEIILTDLQNTQLVDGYLTHTNIGTNGFGAVTWNFNWQAPVDFAGNVTFYAAGIIGNGDNTNSGDIIMTSSLSLNIIDGDGSNSDIGCMNATASNYNPNAITDDGSCEFNIALVDEVIACGGVFLDSGGENGVYEDFEDYSITIYPENEDEYVSLTFNEFALEGCCDYLTIYDGESTSAPLLQPGSNGTSLNGLVFYASPANETGALTITFTSDLSISNSGWAAEIGCTTYGPCFGFEVDVIASFESEEGTSDATAFLDITLGNEPFEYLWSTGETTESIEGLTAGAYSVTVTDSEGCEAEAQFDVIVDPEIYIMGEMVQISTCNGLFYDSGGPEGNFSANENMFIRICPDEDGMAAQLDFTEFNLDWEELTIYDGMGTTSPVLASGNYNDLQGETIVASQENSSGCLTVTFTTSAWAWTTSGWEAFITCHDYVFLGCMDTEALNYDEQAEEDDGSCYYHPGCTDNQYVEYYTQVEELGIDTTLVDYDDGSCVTPYIDDCMSEEALNYNPEATHNEGEDPCIYEVEEWECGMNYTDQRDGYSYQTILIGEQCWMAENLRYIPDEIDTVNVDDGGVASQIDDGFVYTGNEDGDYGVEGNGRYYSYYSAQAAVPYYWHIPTRNEFDVLLTAQSGLDLQSGEEGGFNVEHSGIVTVEGDVVNYSNAGNTTWMWTSTEESPQTAWAVSVVQDDPNVPVVSVPKLFGISVRALFGLPQGAIEGCTDEDYVEYDPLANYDDGSCETVAIEGCTDENALNYYEIATVDDGSCIAIVEGCMDDEYAEYNADANVDDGSCLTEAIFGCTEITAQNYDENANVDDGSCIAHILGCTDDAYVEYDSEATIDNGSCLVIAIFGCMDADAFNYNSAANVDDDSCIPFIEGCTDPNYVEYNGQANVDDNSCVTTVVLGCTIEYALNYNPLANTDDESCEVEGCTNPLFVEYDENATINDGSCAVIAIWGCTNDLYIEYFPPANMDDGSCENLIVMGCTDPLYIEYSGTANVDDGSCENLTVIGCTNPAYLEYNPEAVVDNNSCLTPIVYGCTDSLYIEYNVSANVDDESCENLIVFGCTDNTYIEYNPLANVDDESCTYIAFYGCTDSLFVEYNANANVDDGSCETLKIFGCTDVLAFNYNPIANTNDGSCIPVIIGCMDINYVEYDSLANTSDPSLCITDAIWGCTDIEAINYSPESNSDDGSCFYYLVEINYEEYAEGLVVFTPTILGLGNNYQAYWDFGDGSFSGQTSPSHTYLSNGDFVVELVVFNGDIEVITSIEIDVINATVSIDKVSVSKRIVQVQYFDLMGRSLLIEDIIGCQLYIQKLIYDDGSYEFVKRVNVK
jgi:uncharacterized protein (TIGR02145 family)